MTACCLDKRGELGFVLECAYNKLDNIARHTIEIAVHDEIYVAVLFYVVLE